MLRLNRRLSKPYLNYYENINIRQKILINDNEKASISLALDVCYKRRFNWNPFLPK